MGTISAMTFIPSAIFGQYNGFTGIASAAIKRGQLVCIDDTYHATTNPLYNRYKPVPASGVAAKKWPVGVAISDAAAGQEVTIVGSGNVVNMAVDSDSTGIKVGAPVVCGAYAGTVKAGTVPATGYALTDTMIGVALDSIAVSSYGRIWLNLR